MIGNLVEVFVAFLTGGVVATLLVAPRIGLRSVIAPHTPPAVQLQPRPANDPDVLKAYVKVYSGDGDVVERLRAAALDQAYGVYGINAQLRVESVGQLEQLPSGGVCSRVTIRRLHEEEARHGS